MVGKHWLFSSGWVSHYLSLVARGSAALNFRDDAWFLLLGIFDSISTSDGLSVPSETKDFHF